jgi:hypothetical protein
LFFVQFHRADPLGVTSLSLTFAAPEEVHPLVFDAGFARAKNTKERKNNMPTFYAALSIANAWIVPLLSRYFQ